MPSIGSLKMNELFSLPPCDWLDGYRGFGGFEAGSKRFWNDFETIWVNKMGKPNEKTIKSTEDERKKKKLKLKFEENNSSDCFWNQSDERDLVHRDAFGLVAGSWSSCVRSVCSEWMPGNQTIQFFGDQLVVAIQTFQAFQALNKSQSAFTNWINCEFGASTSAWPLAGPVRKPFASPSRMKKKPSRITASSWRALLTALTELTERSSNSIKQLHRLFCRAQQPS